MSVRVSAILRNMSSGDGVTGLDQPGFGGAFDLCRQAIDEGAALTLIDEPVPIAEIRDVYQRQYVRSTAADSAPTVGFSDTVAALEATDAQELRTAFVQHQQWPWLFVLLVEPSSRALACIGVNHLHATPNDPFPTAHRVGDDRWTTRS